MRFAILDLRLGTGLQEAERRDPAMIAVNSQVSWRRASSRPWRNRPPSIISSIQYGARHPGRLIQSQIANP